MRDLQEKQSSQWRGRLQLQLKGRGIFKEEGGSGQHFANHGRIVETQEGKIEESGMEGKVGWRVTWEDVQSGVRRKHRKEQMTKDTSSWEMTEDGRSDAPGLFRWLCKLPRESILTLC